MKREPTFFIVGAPRCGTTAMSEYLRAHPQVGFSLPKEPHFFSSDLTGFGFRGSYQEYLERFFSHLTPTVRAVGEGSAWYLYSKNAAERILERIPGARFLVMLRNPLEMVVSLHTQLQMSLDEDRRDFAQAWALQEARAQGRQIPRACRDVRILLYRETAALGSQLERLFAVVPRDQVLVVLFDDFAARPHQVYEQVLSFIQVPSDGRLAFPVINASHAHRFRVVGQWIQRPPWFVKLAVERAKLLLGVQSFGLLPFLARLNRRPVGPRRLSGALRADLVDAFTPEVNKLSRLLARDLTGWLQ